jgi:hypothetical protein
VDPQPGEESPEPNAVDLADGLLCALVLGGGSAARVTASREDESDVRVLLGERAVTMSVPAGVGRALVVRLALLAGLDPWETTGALGSLPVRVGPARGEFAVGVTPTASGPVLDVRRIVAAAGAAPDDATPAEEPPAAATPADTAPIETTPIGPTPADTAPVAPPGSGATSPARIGPYAVEAEIGRGAMGIVYRARRDGQDRPVAVKLLNPSIASDPAMAARFVREGRAAALVNDPGVVGVSDFGRLPDGQAYLVMEIVEGRTLEQELEKSGALPPLEAVRIAVRILAALEAAHVRGVVHRDLKPSNVFLTPEGPVKVADFGAALVDDARRSGRTDAGLVLGSPAYMAPEQALGRETDDRADLYSLACVLYRMLSGRPPFRGETLVEVLRQQIEASPEPVSSPHGELPVVLVEAIDRALAKEPDARFRSAGEMRAVLDQALARLGGSDRRDARR